MRNKYFLIVAFGFYAFLYIATSKKDEMLPDPCFNALQGFFSKDTARRNSANLSYGTIPNSDSLICMVYDTTRNINWINVADSLCKISKEQCNKSNVPILIANRQNPNVSTWESRFGKTIVYRVCP
jgi:hypothetical protein